MRYLSYRYGTKARLGSLQEGFIVDVGRVAGFDDLLEFIKAGPQTWAEVEGKLKAVDLKALEDEDRHWAIPFQEGLVSAALANTPKNIFCLGRNYYKHYLEGAIARENATEKPPEAPVYFTKPHTAILGPYEPIPLDPEVTTQLDWEAELGVIIGVGGRKIAPDHAHNHIFGYTVINDVTARDLQFRHGQWFKGKGLDFSCPIGPLVVTPDELPDPVHLAISLKVNGEVKQLANTNQLMFDIPTIIADLSLAITLEPGDIISTGTPEGVGHFRNPPQYLKVGDVMETQVEGIGTLRNRITTSSRVELIARYNAECHTLIEFLTQLQPGQYQLQTECWGWSVKDLLAYLVSRAANAPALMERQLTGNSRLRPDVRPLRHTKGLEQRKNKRVSMMLNELLFHHLM